MAAVCMLTARWQSLSRPRRGPETMTADPARREDLRVDVTVFIVRKHLVEVRLHHLALHRWFVVASAEPVIARRNRLFTALSWVMSGMISDFGSP